MGAGGYTSERPLWSVSTYLNAGQTVLYQYLRQENCNQPYIYETINRTLTVPACGSPAITLEDAWVGPAGTSGGC
jgi:glucoamylase